MFKRLKNTFLHQFLYKISIRSRLLLYFLLLVVIPTSIISYTIYNKSVNIITQKTNATIADKLNIISSGIQQKFESIDDISIAIYQNRDLIRILSSQHPGSASEIVSEMSVLDKLMANYTTTGPAQTVVVPRICIYNRPEYLFYSFTDRVSDISAVEREPWYLGVPRQARYTVVGLDRVTVSSRTVNTLKIVKRLYGIDDMRVQFGGLLMMDVGLDYFNNILLNSKLTPSSLTFVLDQSGKVLICPDEPALGTEFGSIEGKPLIYSDEARQFGSYIEKRDGINMLVSYKKMPQAIGTIVSLTPMSELNGELASLNRVILFVMVICGVIAVITALLLADNVSYPIPKLVRSMGEVQKGNFAISPEYKRNDEFAFLFTSFNKMVGEIRELIDKLYVSEVNKKEAELKSLQAQINPHFLYNTLDSVNWMALELDAANISTMVTSLSDFFRYSLSKGKSVITLGDEKMQVESYLRIQKIRFEDKLDYTMDFPADTLDFLTVKLILQPLVENSILHGINKKPGKGRIDVSAEKQDSLIVIRVKDDGAGADAEELNAILDNRSGKSSFAIKNVDERIKHYFGDGYGLRYYSNEEGGVTVEIRFPAMKTMEGMHAENGTGGR